MGAPVRAGFPRLCSSHTRWAIPVLDGACWGLQVGGAAYIIVDDVDALYREITARVVSVLEPPDDAPWGGREMSVLDPDGNRLRFATTQE